MHFPLKQPHLSIFQHISMLLEMQLACQHMATYMHFPLKQPYFSIFQCCLKYTVLVNMWRHMHFPLKQPYLSIFQRCLKCSVLVTLWRHMHFLLKQPYFSIFRCCLKCSMLVSAIRHARIASLPCRDFINWCTNVLFYGEIHCVCVCENVYFSGEFMWIFCEYLLIEISDNYEVRLLACPVNW